MNQIEVKLFLLHFYFGILTKSGLTGYHSGYMSKTIHLLKPDVMIKQQALLPCMQMDIPTAPRTHMATPKMTRNQYVLQWAPSSPYMSNPLYICPFYPTTIQSTCNNPIHTTTIHSTIWSSYPTYSHPIYNAAVQSTQYPSNPSYIHLTHTTATQSIR